MRNKLEKQANGLEIDINSLNEATGKLTQEIETNSQPYEELIKKFDSTVQDYEDTKRHVISKHNEDTYLSFDIFYFEY